MAREEIRNERFSGHESFPCRYGWLPKIYEAVTTSPDQLTNDDLATQSLGIGRNMVRSIRFWGEATEVTIYSAEDANPLGLTARAYLYCVRDYWLQQFPNQKLVSMASLTAMDGSPGSVFRLSDEDSRQLLFRAGELTSGAVVLQDTMDTQNVKADWDNQEVIGLLGHNHEQ